MENKDFSKLPFYSFNKLGADLFVFAVIFAHRKQLAYAKSSIFHIEVSKIIKCSQSMQVCIFRFIELKEGINLCLEQT